MKIIQIISQVIFQNDSNFDISYYENQNKNFFHPLYFSIIILYFMYFQVFDRRPRSKYVFAFLVLLILTTQLVGWVIRSTFELFNYNGCSYSLSGQMTCSGNLIPDCIGPSINDCNKANVIINLFTAGLVYPVAMLIYLIVYTVVYYFCNCTAFGCLKCQQFLWFVCYGICSALFFITTSNLGILSQRVKVNSQVTATSISLGILCVLIVLTIIFLNIDLNASFIQNQYQQTTQPQPVIDQRVVIIYAQQPQQTNIAMQHLQNQQLYQLQQRNIELQRGIQQRNSLILEQNQIIAQQYYQSDFMGQPVSNVQHPVQGVQFQEVEIR
ncbi:hypothetical protein pb186bvf_003176 [Paramecium bursaria]